MEWIHLSTACWSWIHVNLEIWSEWEKYYYNELIMTMSDNDHKIREKDQTQEQTESSTIHLQPGEERIPGTLL
jgi:hypothetical protein